MAPVAARAEREIEVKSVAGAGGGAGILVECPRCGYDLRGEVASWEASCPLEGRCSECGLEVGWGALLGEGRLPPRWHVEHPRRRPWLRTLGMLVRSARPWRFWSSVGMEQLRRPWRGVRYAVLGVALALLLTSVVEMAVWAGTDAAIRASRNSWGRSPWSQASWARKSNPVTHTATVVLNAVSPGTLIEWSMYERTSYGGRLETFPYPRWVEQGELGAPLLFASVIPLSYALLPATLGSAKVRRWHLVRAVCLGAPVTMVVMELTLVVTWTAYTLLFSWVRVRMWGLIEFVFEGGVIWLLVIPTHQWMWWSSVNRRFLKLDRPLAVTAAMLTISGLVTLIVLMGFTPVGGRLLQPFVGRIG